MPIFQNKKRVLPQETGKKKKLLGTTRKWACASGQPRRPPRAHTMTRNVPLPVMSSPKGRSYSCIVTNMNRQKTTVMHRDTLHNQKYKCLEMQHKNMSKHLSCHSASGMSRWVTLSCYIGESQVTQNPMLQSTHGDQSLQYQK